MKKQLLIITCFVAMVVVSFAFLPPKQPRFENLKVLPKNTDKHQMDSVMHHFTNSLGVKCNFCHVRTNDDKKDWNFASDENKNKLAARSMMKMTNKLNKKYFGSEKENGGQAITCYSCHHGQEEPATFPPARQEGSH